MSKRVHYLILGLGLYPQGSGISAARFLLSRGARLTITDKKTARELARPVRDVLAAWRKAPAGTPKPLCVLGRHRVRDIDSAEVIVRNPGVPTRSPLIQRALKLGKPVENDVTLFVQNCALPIVAVTGTRGKSTTAAWIADMFRRAGRRPYLAGNILTSPLALLDTSSPYPLPRGEGYTVILELSSWQLEDLARKKWHPQIAVVTNVLRDHLNTYPSMRAYAKAKANIFRYQTFKDTVILNRDNSWTRDFGHSAPGRSIMVPTRGVRRTFGLAGEHNIANGLLAAAAARAAGIPERAIQSSLKNFKGLPARQELVRVVKGVRYINDTTATTPDATIAALRRFKRVGILIAGGTDKKLVFDELAREIARRVRVLILLPGTATDRLLPLLQRGETGELLKILPVYSMSTAVRAASRLARRSDSVLLSPGGTSFGLFKNEFDRGAQFVRAVKKL